METSCARGPEAVKSDLLGPGRTGASHELLRCVSRSCTPTKCWRLCENQLGAAARDLEQVLQREPRHRVRDRLGERSTLSGSQGDAAYVTVYTGLLYQSGHACMYTKLTERLSIELCLFVETMLSHSELQGIPLLVLANKMDLEVRIYKALSSLAPVIVHAHNHALLNAMAIERAQRERNLAAAGRRVAQGRRGRAPDLRAHDRRHRDSCPLAHRRGQVERPVLCKSSLYRFLENFNASKQREKANTIIDKGVAGEEKD